jgi:hypothetical protein
MFSISLALAGISNLPDLSDVRLLVSLDRKGSCADYHKLNFMIF